MSVLKHGDQMIIDEKTKTLRFTRNNTSVKSPTHEDNKVFFHNGFGTIGIGSVVSLVHLISGLQLVRKEGDPNRPELIFFELKTPGA